MANYYPQHTLPSGDLIGALGGCPFWVEEPRAGAVNYATLYPYVANSPPAQYTISIGSAFPVVASDYTLSFDVSPTSPGGVLRVRLTHTLQDFSTPEIGLLKVVIACKRQRVYVNFRTNANGFAGLAINWLNTYTAGAFSISNVAITNGTDPQEYGYADDWANNTRTTDTGVKRNLGDYLSQIISWSGLGVADIANYGTAGRGVTNYQTSNAQPRELQIVATLTGDGGANSYAKARAKLENLLLRYDPVTRKNRAIRFHFQAPDDCGDCRCPHYVFEARYVGDGLQQTYTNGVGELMSLRFELSTPVWDYSENTPAIAATVATGSTTNALRRLPSGEYTSIAGPSVLHGLTELPDGRIVFSGGTTLRFYTPATNTWTASSAGPAGTVYRKIAADKYGRIWCLDDTTNVLLYYTVSSGTWTSVAHGLGTLSSLLTTKAGEMFVTGNTSPFFKMWDNASGTLITVPGITVNGAIHAMTEACGGRVFIVGAMTTPFSGSFFYNPVSQSAAAGNATSFGSGGYLETQTHPLTCDIYAGPPTNLSRYAGASFATFGAGVNNTVRGIAFSRAGDIFIGGKFTLSGTKALSYFARITNGIYYKEPVTMSGNTVFSMLTASDGSVYAAGDFSATFNNSASTTIRYCGSEAVNPVIKIVGTGSGAQIYSIRSETTGTNILFNPLTVGGGETITIDTRRGTIKSSYGGNVTGALSGGSAITSFRLLPPENGDCCRDNVIKVLVLSGTCTITLNYKNQYKSVNSEALCE